jgi:hypothetical protein
MCCITSATKLVLSPVICQLSWFFASLLEALTYVQVIACLSFVYNCCKNFVVIVQNLFHMPHYQDRGHVRTSWWDYLWLLIPVIWQCVIVPMNPTFVQSYTKNYSFEHFVAIVFQLMTQNQFTHRNIIYLLFHCSFDNLPPSFLIDIFQVTLNFPLSFLAKPFHPLRECTFSKNKIYWHICT